MANKRLRRPLLKFEIQEAQKESMSAAEAARYLGVSFDTYKKYAKFYGIYEDLLNPTGIGVAKGFSITRPNSKKLKDIFENKHPDYPLQRLKWRMIRRGLIDDVCISCGFNEARITDGKLPIILVFKDEHNDYTPTNLVTLCYNCCFLTKDAPTVVNRKHVDGAVHGTYTTRSHKTDNDPTELSAGMSIEPENDLSDEEIAELRREIARELGRG
jgi:hypothetical protein